VVGQAAFGADDATVGDAVVGQHDSATCAPVSWPRGLLRARPCCAGH
jgi:hypothetical protein